MDELQDWESTTPSPDQATINSSGPAGPFGVLTINGRPNFRYPFTTSDALWLARFVIGEAGGRDDPGSRAVIWTMFNRYAFFTHRVYPKTTSPSSRLVECHAADEAGGRYKAEARRRHQCNALE